MKVTASLKYPVILPISVGLIALVLYGFFVPRFSVWRIEQIIHRALPLGSSKKDVETWLKSHPYIKYDGPIGLGNSQQYFAIAAKVSNSGPWFETKQELNITFYFDGDDLSSVVVKQFRYSF